MIPCWLTHVGEWVCHWEFADGNEREVMGGGGGGGDRVGAVGDVPAFGFRGEVGLFVVDG